MKSWNFGTIKLTEPTNFMEFINCICMRETIALSSENQFKCEECGIVFSSQQELQRHAKEQHVGTA
ncbi:MAG TPA: C2H2-type zinc finger protein [Nitrososphaeraceae archaeon]|jgi:transcription initiation factor IIE alpha subunit|nr:C2H2-type zinc finger protein [Nitrososphaeraceae archaeon]